MSSAQDKWVWRQSLSPVPVIRLEEQSGIRSTLLGQDHISHDYALLCFPSHSQVMWGNGHSDLGSPPVDKVNKASTVYVLLLLCL